MKKAINEFFNKRFCKYFIIILLIIVVMDILSIANESFDRFFTYLIPFKYALKCTLMTSLPLLPSCITFAATTTTFVVFRKTSIKGYSFTFAVLYSICATRIFSERQKAN